MYGVLFASISSASTYSMLFAPAVLLPSSCSLVCTVHSIVSFPPSLNEKMSFEHVFFYFVDESTTLHSGCTRSSTTRIFFRFCNGFFCWLFDFGLLPGYVSCLRCGAIVSLSISLAPTQLGSCMAVCSLVCLACLYVSELFHA